MNKETTKAYDEHLVAKQEVTELREALDEMDKQFELLEKKWALANRTEKVLFKKYMRAMEEQYPTEK